MITSAVVFVVTLVPDFTLIPTVGGSTGAQTAILVALHVAAACVIVWMLTTSSRTRPHSRPQRQVLTPALPT
jgi:uncharacterized membrane protein